MIENNATKNKKDHSVKEDTENEAIKVVKNILGGLEYAFDLFFSLF